MERPKIIVFAGPNGSGKSTISSVIRSQSAMFGLPYSNADDIKKAVHGTDLKAAQMAEQQRLAWVQQKQSFCFETVLSSDHILKLLQQAKEQGFFIQAFIIVTADPDINVLHVKSRKMEGGHDIPEDRIRIRYQRSLANVKELVSLADECDIYDNSQQYPLRFFHKSQEKMLFQEIPFWTYGEIWKLTCQEEPMERDDLNGSDEFTYKVQKKWKGWGDV